MSVNGHSHAPLTMSGPQRTACLRKLGLEGGWLLLSIAEMLDLRKSMNGALAENERLNKQTAQLIAKWIADQEKAVAALNRMKKFCEGLSVRQDLPFPVTADALAELTAIAADLKHFAATDPNATGAEKKEGA